MAHPILLGNDGWNYPDWEGPFYPPGLPAEEYLSYCADRFPIVEVDSTFYRPPAPAVVRGWIRKTPESFRFILKVPRSITHEKALLDCEREADGFIEAIRPLGKRLRGAFLQFGYFNQAAFASLGDFLGRLDPFLARWPHAEIPLAVELRNPRWMVPPLAEVLRDHNTALILTDQSWMPSPAEVAARMDVVTGPFAMFRFLGDRDGIEKITKAWDRVVVDQSAGLAATAEVIRELAGRVPVCAIATNHYAGHSPATVRDLRRLLDIPEPTPPPRQRTTLFD